MERRAALERRRAQTSRRLVAFFAMAFSVLALALGAGRSQAQDEKFAPVSYALSSCAQAGKGGKIGMMTDARKEQFAREMISAGAFPAGIDWRKPCRLRFVEDL